MPNFVGPDGKVYDFRDEALLPESLAELRAGGFRPESAEPQTIGEQIGSAVAEPLQTAGEGLMRGFSAGLSEAGAELGPQYPGQPTRATDAQRKERDELNAFAKSEKLRRREENPVSSFIGEGAGMLASPVSVAGEAATAGMVGKTVLGRVGQSAARGAVEGALFGAGNSLADDTLGDEETNAERLIFSTGLDAVFGGLGGGLGHALVEGGSKLAAKAAKSLGGIDLGEFASSKAYKAAYGTKKDLDKLGEERANEIGRMMLDRGHLGEGLNARNAAGILESVTKDKEAVGAQLGKMLDDFDAQAGRGGVDYAATARELDNFEAGLSPYQRRKIGTELKKAKEIVAELDESGAGLSALNEFKRDLQAEAKWSHADVATQGVLGDLKRDLSRIVRSDFDAQITKQFGTTAGKDLQATNALWGKLADAERVAEHGAERLGANATYGLRDVGVGAAAFLKDSAADAIVPGAGLVKGLVGAIASKLVRERGSGIIARLADQLSNSPALTTLSKSFAQRAASSAPQLGQYAGRLSEAAAISAQHALATHMVLGQMDPNYQLQANMAGFLPEDSVETAGALNKAHGLASISVKLEEQQKELTKSLDSVFAGDGKQVSAGKKSERKAKDTAYEAKINEVMKLANDPSALIDRIAGNMGRLDTVAPGIASRLAQSADRAVRYLASEVKQPAPKGPLALPWKPSETEKLSFARKYQTVVDPMSALRHAAAGTMTTDEVKALQAVYPKLARLAADQLLSKMAGHKGHVPYKAKLMMSMLTGISPDGSDNGVAIARNQAAIKAPSSRPDAGGLGNNMGKTEFKASNRMATPGQRREMRDEQ